MDEMTNKERRKAADELEIRLAEEQKNEKANIEKKAALEWVSLLAEQ